MLRQLKPLTEILSDEPTPEPNDTERLDWLERQSDGRLFPKTTHVDYNVENSTAADRKGTPGWYYYSHKEFIDGIYHGPFNTFRAAIDAAMDAQAEGGPR